MQQKQLIGLMEAEMANDNNNSNLDTAVYSLWFGLDYGSIITSYALCRTIEEMGRKPYLMQKLPELWRIYKENMLSDLSFRNYLWITRVLVKAQQGDMTAEVLPGWADMVDGSSVYMMDQSAAPILLANYSPYQ